MRFHLDLRTICDLFLAAPQQARTTETHP